MIRFHSHLAPLMVDANSIYPNPENPNNGDVDSIIISIVKNGCYRPIYVDESGMILAGHHLYAALLELGATQVPASFLDSEPESDEAYRILLADNSIARNSRIDTSQEVRVLGMLDDYDGTGYTREEVEEMLAKEDAQTPLRFPEEGVGSTDYRQTHCTCCGQELP